MTPIRQRFLAQLEPRAHILDAGCGSGRDAKALAEAGFQVTAFDASAELARLASAHCGFEVAVRRFEDVDEVEAFDGIWCCASLLHVPLAAMPATLGRLWRALRPGGTLYVSFKHGTGERVHGGRRFTDADEATLCQWFGRLPDVHRLEVWLTDDQRPDRAERWTNALATRKPGPSQRLVTGGTDHFLPHLSEAFTRATQADLAVAFIKTTGLRLLLPDLESMVEAGAPRRMRVLTSDYLDTQCAVGRQGRDHTRVHWHQAGLAELGLPHCQHAGFQVHVEVGQRDGFRDPQPRRGDQPEQRLVGGRAKSIAGPQLPGRLQQRFDLLGLVDVWCHPSRDGPEGRVVRYFGLGLELLQPAQEGSQPSQPPRRRLSAGLAALRLSCPLRHQLHGQRSGVLRCLDEAREVRQGMARRAQMQAQAPPLGQVLLHPRLQIHRRVHAALPNQGKATSARRC